MRFSRGSQAFTPASSFRAVSGTVINSDKYNNAAYPCKKGLAKPPESSATGVSLQIVVPALGDSISDGTVATVLKKAGDSVAENETIAQVETDKVTIDIKAPSDGTILGVVVQEQDTVVPGQLVATLDDAAAQAKIVGASQPPKQPNTTATPAPPVTSAAPAEQPAAAPPTHHTPTSTSQRTSGIHFPPRMMSDGRRISALPAAEAAAAVEHWTAATAAAVQAAAPAAAHPPPSQSTAGAWVSSPQQQQQHQGVPDAPSKFATSVTRLTQMPKRRELSARDMELIELGGAAP